jgi:hypothetical protein
MFVVVLKPNIDQPYRFAEADMLAAFGHFGAGEHQGKILASITEYPVSDLKREVGVC